MCTKLPAPSAAAAAVFVKLDERGVMMSSLSDSHSLLYCSASVIAKIYESIGASARTLWCMRHLCAVG